MPVTCRPTVQIKPVSVRPFYSPFNYVPVSPVAFKCVYYVNTGFEI